jgi:hypothetical protein
MARPSTPGVACARFDPPRRAGRCAVGGGCRSPSSHGGGRPPEAASHLLSRSHRLIWPNIDQLASPPQPRVRDGLLQRAETRRRGRPGRDGVDEVARLGERLLLAPQPLRELAAAWASAITSIAVYRAWVAPCVPRRRRRGRVRTPDRVRPPSARPLDRSSTMTSRSSNARDALRSAALAVATGCSRSDPSGDELLIDFPYAGTPTER